MAGDDWTVVGSRGRPRKPRQPPSSGPRLSDRSGGSPAAGTRAARRSAQAAGDDAVPERQLEAGTEAPEPLPGWGASNGHGSGMQGRARRAKRRQAWVERSPAERVESLKRSVLEAKKDVQASGFFAALMAALHATCGDSDHEEQAADAGDSRPDGHGGHSNEDSAAKPATGSASQQQERLGAEGSQGSGGSATMAVDQASGSSPMATDGSPQRDTATNTQLQNGAAAAHHVAGHSPNSCAAAAKTHLAEAEPQEGGRALHSKAAASQQQQWRWTDVQELVAYGLGSFEAGPVPRCQLALTLLLAEAAGTRLTMPPQLFDPAFTEVDKRLLREMGCALIPRNEHGRRAFGESGHGHAATNGHVRAAANGHAAGMKPTAGTAAASRSGGGGSGALVYLAHCKPELCNALLDANWTPSQLASIAIIGNSMYTCEETWAVKSMRQVFASRPSRTLALARAHAMAETGIPECGFPITGAFNDVAFHVVTTPDIAAMPVADCDSD